MSDDLVAELTRADGIVAVTKETVVALIGEVGRLKAKAVQQSARIEALEAENARLRAGINGVVNFQSRMTRSQVRESCAEILGNKTVGLNNQSPFAEAMLGYKARAEKAESALAEARKVIEPIVSRLEWDGHMQRWALAPDMPAGSITAARRFIASQEPAEQEK